MLSKKHRLNLSTAENSQLFSKSERFSTDNLLFYYQSNRSYLKVSAVTPTRLFNKATERNQKRRLIYQLINQINNEFKKKEKPSLLELNLDLIIVYKKHKALAKDKTLARNKVLAKDKALAKDLEKELKLFFDKILKNNEIL